MNPIRIPSVLASLVLSAVALAAASSPAAAAGEARSTADAAPSAVATAGTVSAPHPVDPRRLERLARLDAGQWEVIERLLELDPAAWNTFEAVVEHVAGASPGGPAGAVAIGARPPADGPVAPAGLPETVNTILSRVNAIRTTVSSLSSRTPDRPDVRSLVAEVDLDDLRDLLDEVGTTLRGLVDVARELRAGYDTFDAMSFRARIHAVLADFEHLSGLYQRLLCVDDPDFPVREIGTASLGRLIDRAPAVALYTMSTILEAIAPDWDTRLAAVAEAVPAEVTGFCTGENRATDAFLVDAAATVCNALRPKRVGTDLALVKAKVAEGLLVFRFAKNRVPEEIEVTAGATAVAGGTAGTKVKNPAYEAVEQWIDRFENMKDALSDLGDRRKDCLDADHDVEEALADCAKDACACAAPLSVLLDGEVPPSYEYVADLVDARIRQSEDVGLPGTADARARHDEAVGASSATAAGYGLLCEAYASLQQSTVGAPPSVPAASPLHGNGPRRR